MIFYSLFRSPSFKCNLALFTAVNVAVCLSVIAGRLFELGHLEQQIYTEVKKSQSGDKEVVTSASRRWHNHNRKKKNEKIDKMSI